MNTAIPVLRFRAGELQLGLVAAAVAWLGDGAPDCPHIGRLLGLPAAGSADSRMLSLAAYGRTRRLLVDGPIAVRHLASADLLPAPALLRSRRRGVLGYAREEEQVVVLLDVAWLLKEGQPC